MKLNQEILTIAEAIKKAVTVEKIYLFGSYAYGVPNGDSDYDFFVTIPDGGMKPLEATRKARLALIHTARQTPVDILTEYQSSFDERKHCNTLERKIFNDGVILYER
jgi:predicted nucleotidyltransferase